MPPHNPLPGRELGATAHLEHEMRRGYSVPGTSRATSHPDRLLHGICWGTAFGSMLCSLCSSLLLGCRDQPPPQTRKGPLHICAQSILLRHLMLS